jgi:hypothetical protein
MTAIEMRRRLTRGITTGDVVDEGVDRAREVDRVSPAYSRPLNPALVS